MVMTTTTTETLTPRPSVYRSIDRPTDRDQQGHDVERLHLCTSLAALYHLLLLLDLAATVRPSAHSFRPARLLLCGATHSPPHPTPPHPIPYMCMCDTNQPTVP